MIHSRLLTVIGSTIFASYLAHIQYGAAYPLTQASESVAFIGGVLYIMDVFIKEGVNLDR
jgi:uncharacterized membrane protein YjjP (DUF1212 family)